MIGTLKMAGAFERSLSQGGSKLSVAALGNLT